MWWRGRGTLNEQEDRIMIQSGLQVGVHHLLMAEGQRTCLLFQRMTFIGIQCLEGDGTITAIENHERGNYSESGENKDDWYEANLVSTRDYKASQRGG